MAESPEMQHELDVLWLLERQCILAECKAGAFPFAAKRGAPAGLDKSLRELVGKADEQLGRAERQLRSDGFDTAEGRYLPSIDTIHRLNVTLDALPTTTIESMLAEAGILASTAANLIVSLHDLRCVVEILRLPSLVLDYITRRISLQRRSVFTSDELDLLGYYLDHQLIFSTEPDAIFLHAYSERVDAYFHGIDSGIPCPRPQPRFSNIVLALVETLEQRKCDHYMDGALFLLRDAVAFGSKLDEEAKSLTERARNGHVTVQVSTDSSCLVLHLCDGRPNENFLQGATDDAAQRYPLKQVAGVGRSIRASMAGSIRVCLPGNRRHLEVPKHKS